LSVCRLAKQVAAHYPELDVDLLLTAAISTTSQLDELCYDAPSPTPWKASSSAHHDGFETVSKAMDASRFSRELEDHRSTSADQPSRPIRVWLAEAAMIREALVFHYLDDLDRSSRPSALRWRSIPANPSGRLQRRPRRKFLASINS